MRKIACLLIFMLWVFLSQAQIKTNTFNFHKRNCTVIEILDSVKSKMGIHHWNTYGLLENAKRVPGLFNNATIEKVMEVCSKNQYFTLALDEGVIIVKPRTINFYAVIVDDHGAPVAGATIYIEGRENETSNSRGEVYLKNVFANAKIKITAVNIESLEMYLEGKTNQEIQVKRSTHTLNGISVLGSTGYQIIHRKHSSTGFFVISNTAFNQQSTNKISERIKGISLGVSPTVNKVSGVNMPKLFSVSLRTTILAMSDPLIVVDNLPFFENIDDLNPDDIWSISIHKDASATAQWGSKSGNGVIVITTKSGKYGQPREFAINSSLTIGQEPDVFYYPIMDPNDKLALTQYLFKSGYYNDFETSPIPLALPTAVEKLILNRDGKLSGADLEAQLEALKYDKREDLRRYVYRKNIEKHFSARVSGGTADHSYYLSIGYDKNEPVIQGSWTTKKSLFLNHSYHYKNWLEISSAVLYLENQSHNNEGVPESREPMANANGDPVSQPRDWRQAYIDTAGKKYLLDWNFRPLQDFRLRNITRKDVNLLLRTSWKVQLLNGLHFNVLYQYQKIDGERQDVKNAESYYVRDLINGYSQRIANGIYRPIPVGNILDQVNTHKVVNNLRTQLLGQRKFGTRHAMKIQTGIEKIRITTNVNPILIYGYQPNLPNAQSNLNYTSHFTQYANPLSSPLIPTAAPSSYAEANYLSYFAIGNYDYNTRVNFSASARMDKTELFPEIVSSKFITLFSSGIGWNISAEPFYKVDWLPYLKLRLNYGANGNAPLTTIVTPINQSVTRITGNALSGLPRPGWERVNTLSAGFDIGTRNNNIEACVDFYQKRAKDLVGLRQLRPGAPDSLVADNMGEMNGYGVDVVFSSINIRRKFKWTTKLLFSYVADKITRYSDTAMPGWKICEQHYQGIVVGKPLYGVFSYRYAGLEKETGDPQGYLDDHISKKYSDILKRPAARELRYHGRSTPAVFGNLINQFSLGAFSMAVVVSYKLGYYFRRASVNYSQLLSGLPDGSADYKDRWQKMGDELKTNIPSLVLDPQPGRDEFYSYNETLVEKGDHIRLQAINTSVDLPVKSLNKYYLQSCNLYLNVTNLGIMWRANNYGIDPDNLTYFPEPRSVCIGVKMNFR